MRWPWRFFRCHTITFLSLISCQVTSLFQSFWFWSKFQRSAGSRMMIANIERAHTHKTEVALNPGWLLEVFGSFFIFWWSFSGLLVRRRGNSPWKSWFILGLLRAFFEFTFRSLLLVLLVGQEAGCEKNRCRSMLPPCHSMSLYLCSMSRCP